MTTGDRPVSSLKMSRSTRAFRNAPTETNTFYPRLLGTRGAVACEHHLAADAAADVLKAGGNAVDAMVAGVLVEGVVNPQMHTVGGECPILVCMADGKVEAINGNTEAPEAATPEAYRRRGFSDMPEEGILAAGVPAAFDALVTALSRYGSMSFADVAAPAIALARDGFPMHRGLRNQERFGVRDLADRFRRDWPGSAALYLPDGTVPDEGDIIRNPALAATFDHLASLEQAASGSRTDRLRKVREGFYAGDIAAEIARFSAERDGFLALSDLARYETLVEDPVGFDFAGTTLYKCGFWTQGPTMLQALAILEPVDLAGFGHNSVDYLHALIETINLVFADREQYYADPRHVDVPAEALLSRDYAALRRELIDMTRAGSAELRPGDPRRAAALLPETERLGGGAWGPGTVHVDVIDAAGNMVAATPSGAWIKSCEVVPSLGFPLGNRLMTFYLDPPHHPNRVAPFKRPRTTISPSLASKGGRPWMVFGSMGGDQQDQWQLQFFLNRTLFGMGVQEAIEAPKLSSEHFPGFFAPHDRFANRVRIEPRVGADVLEALQRRGHDVEVAADWSEGYLLAASRDPETGVLEAGCDPRGAKADVFPACALCW